MQITVKGSWLNACGKGNADRTFEVVKVVPTMAREGSGFEVMYEIECNGQPWTVAKCRLADPVEADGPTEATRDPDF